jgi:hypothetical protein
VLEKKIPTNHHRNVIQFNKIQKNNIQISLIFGGKKNLIMYFIENNLRMNLNFFHLDNYQ